MRTILIVSLALAFSLAQMVPLAPANAAATTIKGSKSNVSFRQAKPPERVIQTQSSVTLQRHTPPAPQKATTVRGSKSNSSY